MITQHACTTVSRFLLLVPGRAAQSVRRLSQEPEFPGTIPGPAIYFVSASADSRRTDISYLGKCVHEVLTG